MADHRTLREKLEDMANQTESPHEAQIAREKLLAMGEGARLPPRRPPSAPSPGWYSSSYGTSATTSTSSWGTSYAANVFVFIRREPS